MKKYLFLIIVIMVTTLFATAKTDFLSSFKTCSNYSESGTVNTQGMQVTSNKTIEGWEGNKCVYKEKVSFSGIDSTTICKFTKSQLDEIVSVMQAYELVQKYSNEKVDTSSLEANQNNPVVKVWQKYIQDSSVCNISGLKGLE